MVQFSFDANKHEPMQERGAIPEGQYLASIVESDKKPTQAGTGHYLELIFKVQSGEYRGRQVWARLNLNNPSQQVVEIAQHELSSICRAANVMQLQDSVQLHNIPMLIRVKVRQFDGKDQNYITSYAGQAIKATDPPQEAETTPEFDQHWDGGAPF